MGGCLPSRALAQNPFSDSTGEVARSYWLPGNPRGLTPAARQANGNPRGLKPAARHADGSPGGGAPPGGRG